MIYTKYLTLWALFQRNPNNSDWGKIQTSVIHTQIHLRLIPPFISFRASYVWTHRQAQTNFGTPYGASYDCAHRQEPRTPHPLPLPYPQPHPLAQNYCIHLCPKDSIFSSLLICIVDHRSLYRIPTNQQNTADWPGWNYCLYEYTGSFPDPILLSYFIWHTAIHDI